jgi:replication-associated recombination protein RarA
MQIQKSEIVVPIVKEEELIRVLDIDSTVINSFNKTDKKYLEKLCGYLANHILTIQEFHLNNMEEKKEYQVSARKYRPDLFSKVVGQEHITKTLKNAISNKRIAHAYLFTGPRGVGKTTTARIFAKALNCLNPNGAEPCNSCEMCKSIGDNISLDFIEIDGASNRGIDEIRTLRDSVKHAPTIGKYKVYIIDEVHMLTKESFNAFLNT